MKLKKLFALALAVCMMVSVMPTSFAGNGFLSLDGAQPAATTSGPSLTLDTPGTVSGGSVVTPSVSQPVQNVYRPYILSNPYGISTLADEGETVESTASVPSKTELLAEAGSGGATVGYVGDGTGTGGNTVTKNDNYTDDTGNTIIISEFYTDNATSEQYDVSTSGLSDYPQKWKKGVHKMILKSEALGLEASMDILNCSDIPGAGYSQCSPAEQYNKLYYSITGFGSATEYAVSKNDLWETSVQYTVSIQK